MNGNTTRVNGKAEEASRVGDDIARILALPYSPPGQIIAALKGLQSDPDRLAAVLGGFSTAGSASDRLTGFRDAGGALLQAELGRRSVGAISVSYTHLRAHETVLDLVCRLLLEKK